MKKLWAEFKKFITRGSVMDLAVGTIIGAAFTSIVSALSNGILKPLINWFIYLIVGSKNVDQMYTILVKALDANGAIDLTNSIYIDWGAFISAIINFLLVALVLFWIVKTFNAIKDAQENVANIDKRIAQKIKLGIKLTKKEETRKAAIEAEQAKKEAEKQAQEEAAKAAAEAEKNKVTSEMLLAQILDELKKQEK